MGCSNYLYFDTWSLCDWELYGEPKGRGASAVTTYKILKHGLYTWHILKVDQDKIVMWIQPNKQSRWDALGIKELR